MEQNSTFVGLDLHKATIAVALADGGRQGEVRSFGVIENEPAAIDRLLRKLARPRRTLRFCYEAGPCGYEVYRQLIDAGQDCIVVAPALIPRRSADRVKTDRRDAISLARLHRAGELTAVWVPDSDHEAMRDLVRARRGAVRSVRRGRQRLSGFLLRHGRTGSAKPGTLAYKRWLTTVHFAHPAQQIVLQNYIDSVTSAEERRDQLTEQIRELLPRWQMADVVNALQALRGFDLVTAATVVAEIGDLTRFEDARKLMAFVGLTPSEFSSGQTVRRGAITKTGNTEARRVLIEAAWAYRLPARVSRRLLDRQDGISEVVRSIAWKAQTRLCRRYQRLTASGKKTPVVVTAIARELLGFVWAIARQVRPQSA
ncbi:MAG: IS110 family transposase [Terriglobia bacterium]